MTAANQVNKTLGEQMADLLRRKPKNFDVTFSVGPDKIEVKAVKFILKAASPVFEREFEENWENGIVTDDNGIHLLNEDPTAFQLFVNLLILDAWSVDALKALKLSPNNLLNLFGFCRRYKITKAIPNLEEAAEAFIQSFDKNTDAFLGISRDNLETIFSFENIPQNETMIFQSACRWAGNKCTIEGLEPTGENYRKVLGACLFQIRFPTMSTEEFTKVNLLKKNVLKAEEKLAVYEYIGLDSDEKKNWDKSQLPFKTNPRAGAKPNRSNSEKAPPQPQITMNPKELNLSSSFDGSVLSLPQQFKLTTSPSFECDGSEHERSNKVARKRNAEKLGLCSKPGAQTPNLSMGIIQFTSATLHSQTHDHYTRLPFERTYVNEKILLHGFGFSGPIGRDANFDVTVRIMKCGSRSCKFMSRTFKKKLFARAGKIFHFLLDEPISVASNTYDSYWVDCYVITFSLQGFYNIPEYKVDNARDELLEASDVEFYLSSDWNNGSPLAELLFKKI